MSKSYYQELTSRNTGLLTAEEQEKIKKTRILIAGCGVGSVVAAAAARFGFANFVLADGDKVEISNLNRQEYSKNDVGVNKAIALKKRLLSINPGVKVKVMPKFVKVGNVKSLLKDVDIIIDTIDPEDGKAILALHQEARKNKKFVISPYDMGFGSLVIVYKPEGKTYKELLGYAKNKKVATIQQDDFYNRFLNHTMKFIPSYLVPAVDKLLKGEIKHFPQLIIAAQILSGCVINLMRKIAIGEKLSGNPYILKIDPELSLNWQKNKRKIYA
jgi:molybdopterin/thiamine biosynthesis adenylyltransferase